jgi:hypothetical protein
MKHLPILSIFSLALICSLSAQPAQFEPRGIGGGGALFFPTINPANDQEFYVACDLSAMFHSTDFGNHYDQLHFTKLSAGNTSTYEFTNNPNIAYSNFNDGNDGYPVKTTDGGNTWTQLTGYDLNNYGPVYRMKANFDKPNQLLINSYGDILISNDGGASFSVAKHTVNNGAGLIMGGVFWDGANIYIGTNEGLLVSNNSGASFSVMPVSGISAGNVVWSFAGAKNGVNTRFVCITASPNDTYNGVMPWDYYNFATGVYTMDNASGVWVSRSAGMDFSNDFIMYAAMARNDLETIYLGGHDNSTGGPLVYKSANGGQSWDKVFKTNNNANIITAWEGHQGDKGWGWSENCFGITVAPNNSNKVMFANYSNIQLSSDGGANWKQAYVRNSDQHPAGAPTPTKQSYHSIGLENTTCWQVMWADATHLMAAYSDIGGIRSSDGGQSWGFTYNGFSVNSVYRYSRDANALYAACSNIHDMYQSTRLQDAQLDANDGNGKIVYSTDNGANWSNMHVFNHPVFWVEADPNTPNRLYASVIHYGGTQGNQQGGIYRTDESNKLATAVWTKLPNPPRTEGHPACIVVLKDGKVVCTFSGRRGSNSSFTASSGVFLYDPATNTWSDRSHSGMYYWTKDVVIDPTDPTQNTWYTCVFSGWGGAPNGLGGLYKTTDRGLNWVKLSGSQFDRVSSMSFNPQNSAQAYLTTETQGLWVCQNIHANAPVWTLVDSYPFRQPERVYFNPFNTNEMWVSSFGNGMRVGNFTATATETPTFNASEIKVYPNPVEDVLHIDLKGQEGLLQVYNATGDWVESKQISTRITVLSTEHWPKGIYFVKFRERVIKIVRP